jgi:beta-lactamase class A
MYSRQLLNQNDTGLLLSFMQNTNNETLIPAALPAGAVVYHKYGNLNNNLHDVAVIIYNGRTYVLAIYTRSNGLADYTQSTALIRRITQAVIDSYP